MELEQLFKHHDQGRVRDEMVLRVVFFFILGARTEPTSEEARGEPRCGYWEDFLWELTSNRRIDQEEREKQSVVLLSVCHVGGDPLPQHRHQNTVCPPRKHV